MKNKKTHTFVMLMVLALLASPSFAQKGFNLSLSGIGQNSWIFNSDDSDNDAFSYKAYIHPAFGLGAGYNFTDNAGLGLDVIYSFQGRKQEVNGVETRYKLDYLKVPLYFHFNTNPEAKWMFSANAGPQMSILTTAKMLDASDNETDLKDQDVYEDLSIGAFASAGAEYKLTDNLQLFALARFDMDFTNAENEDATGYNPDRANSYNSTLGLQVGLRYKLGK